MIKSNGNPRFHGRELKVSINSNRTEKHRLSKNVLERKRMSGEVITRTE